MSLRVGIDASNLRAGGGVTHLTHLLAAARPADHGIDRVIVWGHRHVLAHLPPAPWLVPTSDAALDGSALRRWQFQHRRLDALARDAVDVLFVPGGSFSGRFRPYVTMFRNMLLAMPDEAGRYGWSATGIRLRLLARIQRRAMQHAAGVIALSPFAEQVLVRDVGVRGVPIAVIPHGVDDAFRQRPAARRSPHQCTPAEPFRLLYVSIVDLYKHQWHVVEAVADLRRAGWPVSLDLVGPAYGPAMARLQSVMHRVDPDGSWVRYVGAVPQSSLPAIYHSAEGFVFASSCENMPNILLEAMASALPIACSDRRPMPDFLGDAGEYFDPQVPSSIRAALERLLSDDERLAELAARAAARAAGYSWERTAAQTLAFVAAAARPS